MKKINNNILAVLILTISVLYQVHCAIRGFDLTDEGYLMTIYQWFGTDVYYAQGAGGYPLTAYLGWLLNGIFPEGGILAMRLWGILLVTMTGVVLYLYLRRYFHERIALVGLLMQSIFVAQDPKPFGYNTLTALIACVAVILLVEGTIRRRSWMLVGGGVLLGVNVFVRIPNITGLAFLIIPFLYNCKGLHELQLLKSTRQALLVVVGFIVAMAGTWAFLVHIGADKLVVDLITSIDDTLGGKSTHGSTSMINKYLENFFLSIQFFIIFVVGMLVCSMSRLVKNIIGKLIIWFIAFQIVYRMTYLNSNVLGDSVLGMMNGIGIFGACYYLMKGSTMRTLALTGILFSLVIPMGSDQGFQTMWVGTWLVLPMGLSGLYTLVLQTEEQQWHTSFWLSNEETSGYRKLRINVPQNLRTAFFICLGTFILATVAKVENRAYYDPGHKTEKTYAIHSHKSKGIYTTERRAAVINPLLKELDKYVKPGETLLVYDSSPLLYYLTDTKPFAGISWPCVFYGQQYVDKFKAAEASTQQMPVLVMQQYYSSNNWSHPLKEYISPKFDASFSSKEMSKNIFRFIKQHHYRVVWSNKYYKIMVPGLEEVSQ